MDYLTQIDMLGRLVLRINKAKDLLDRAEAYFEEHHREWSDGVAGEFQDLLEAKRDMIDYELHRVERMGWDIVLHRNPYGPY